MENANFVQVLTPRKLQPGISKLQEFSGYLDNLLFVLGHFSGVNRYHIPSSQRTIGKVTFATRMLDAYWKFLRMCVASKFIILKSEDFLVPNIRIPII